MNTTYQMLSAKQIVITAQDKQGDELQAIITHCKDKAAFLKSRGKNMRANLWVKALDQMPVNEPTVINYDAIEMTDCELQDTVTKAKPMKSAIVTKTEKKIDKAYSKAKSKEGMKAVKIGGVKQYVPKDMTSNGIGMLRQTANALGRTSKSIVNAQEQAYRYWKAGSNPPHSIQLMN